MTKAAEKDEIENKHNHKHKHKHTHKTPSLEKDEIENEINEPSSQKDPLPSDPGELKLKLPLVDQQETGLGNILPNDEDIKITSPAMQKSQKSKRFWASTRYRASQPEMLSAEFDVSGKDGRIAGDPRNPSSKEQGPTVSVSLPSHQSFWDRMKVSEKEEDDKQNEASGKDKDGKEPTNMIAAAAGLISSLPRPVINHLGDDPYFDYAEIAPDSAINVGLTRKKVRIHSLKDCQNLLQNEAAKNYHHQTSKLHNALFDSMLDILAALHVYVLHMLNLDTAIVLVNTTLALWFYCDDARDYSVKLDFSFLAFSVVFPLTFLVQASFARRDQGLTRLADFKASILSIALLTLTVDWSPGGTSEEKTGGRLSLPRKFNAQVVKDFQDLLQLVYQYLSMPAVSHARNAVFSCKQEDTMRIHGLQNGIMKNLNESMFDLSMHTEEMREYGFPSGEASRLHQYHQHAQQRFEQLRLVKYYQPPQPTGSFGRAYILILPWLTGPYFGWVYEESTSAALTYCLGLFTFLILNGLLSASKGLDDPFCANPRSWMPGIDNIKLEYEMALAVQAIEQYHANVELRMAWRRGEWQKKKRLAGDQRAQG